MSGVARERKLPGHHCHTELAKANGNSTIVIVNRACVNTSCAFVTVTPTSAIATRHHYYGPQDVIMPPISLSNLTSLVKDNSGPFLY